MHLIRDIGKVFSANLLSVLVGMVTGFLIPAFLPLTAYAELKTFTLYVSYVGILHFGFIDGIFVKYGGRRYEEIDKNELIKEKTFLLFFQAGVTILSLLIGILSRDWIFIALALSIIPINLVTFYKLVFQAVGEFTAYSRIMYASSWATLFVQLVILFILRYQTAMPYVGGWVVLNYIVYIALEWRMPLKGIRLGFDLKKIKTLFAVGIFVALGNFAFITFYSIDRWFVKAFYSTASFAYYSFAISIMQTINILTTSLTATFYPYLARLRDHAQMQILKTMMLILGTLLCGSYFVFEIIVRDFIPKYIPTLSIVSILFAAIPAMIIFNVIYVNLYQIERKQKKYFLEMAAVLAISAVLMLTASRFVHDYRIISFITAFSFYLLFLIAMRDFRYLPVGTKDILFILSFLVLFAVCVISIPLFFNLFAFYLGVSILSAASYKKELLHIRQTFLNKKNKQTGVI